MFMYTYQYIYMYISIHIYIHTHEYTYTYTNCTHVFSVKGQTFEELIDKDSEHRCWVAVSENAYGAFLFLTLHDGVGQAWKEVCLSLSFLLSLSFSCFLSLSLAHSLSRLLFEIAYRAILFPLHDGVTGWLRLGGSLKI